MYTTYIIELFLGDDFDERLMSSLASVGRGPFLFIDRPEKIPDVVALATQKFSSLFGLDAVLQFGAMKGVKEST